MTHQRLSLVVALSIAGSLGACAQVTGSARTPKHATKATRLAAIRQAQVWKATDVPSMDLESGPQGPGSFALNETVNCDYKKKEVTGASPKFACVRPPDDELKVKYGRNNGEVFAEVAASRLFWALGFAAERMYPVRVVCRGCPANVRGTEIASIQRKTPGKDIETSEISGWNWSELDQVDSAAGGAPRAHRDALKLLAVLIQHTDSKAEQQRLICVGPRTNVREVESCAETIMLAHDLGLTFGRSTLFNRNPVSSTTWSNGRGPASGVALKVASGTCPDRKPDRSIIRSSLKPDGNSWPTCSCSSATNSFTICLTRRGSSDDRRHRTTRLIRRRWRSGSMLSSRNAMML